MHQSEAHLDAPQSLRRVRVQGFNESAAGVAFVNGEAQSGVPSVVVERLRAIGYRVEDLGPWGEPATQAPALAPSVAPSDGASNPPPIVESPAPQTATQSVEDAPAVAPSDDAGEALAESVDDAGEAARPRRRGIK